MTPKVMGQLQQNLAANSPVSNPKTPNNRKSPKEEFLERLNSIKALLKHIESAELAEDPIYQLILDKFKGAILKMLLSADGSAILSDLAGAFGGAGPSMQAGPPGLPAAAPPPAQVQAPMPQAPGQLPMPGAGNSPAPQMPVS
jgi:hypothetical protein